MKNRVDIDTAAINAITSDDEATMATAISNSVGMLLLALQQTYLGDTPNEKDWNDFCSNHEKFLTNLTVNDLVKNDDSSDYKQTLQQEFSNQFSADIEFILITTNEETSWLDRVTLHVLNENAIATEVTYVFPLRSVLSLVVAALIDDASFSCHYEGTDNEQFNQATADRPLRLLSLLRCLNYIRQEGICHQGVRNALV